MMTVGYMRIPSDFKYMRVYLKEKPRHLGTDSFLLKHPVMERGKRAKIFSPFDALKGFSDAVASKDVLYVNKPELGEEDKEEIGRRLGILHELTHNSRAAKENRVRIKVAYYVPCTDKNNSACGYRGQIVAVTGICMRVDGTVSRSITVDQTIIRFDDILAIEADDLFEDWELYAS